MTAGPPRPWTVERDGLALTVRLTPKAGRDAIDGIETMADGRMVLRARVRAAPSDGEANAGLIRVIAKSLGVAPRDVLLVAGASARIKRLTIRGDGPTLGAALEAMVHPKAG